MYRKFLEHYLACGRPLRRAFSPRLVGKGFTRNVNPPALRGNIYLFAKMLLNQKNNIIYIFII